MNLILLYGPPAVGKLTIAQKLQARTGYKLFHNHLFLNPLREIFDFDHPAHKQLEIAFYFRIIEEAAKSGVDLIVTTGKAGVIRNEFFAKIISLVEEHGGHVYPVQLSAPKQVLLDRLGDASRVRHNKFSIKKDFEAFYTAHPEIIETILYKEHLHIDTSLYTPEKIVEKIISYYSLIIKK